MWQYVLFDKQISPAFFLDGFFLRLADMMISLESQVFDEIVII